MTGEKCWTISSSNLRKPVHRHDLDPFSAKIPPLAAICSLPAPPSAPSSATWTTAAGDGDGDLERCFRGISSASLAVGLLDPLRKAQLSRNAPPHDLALLTSAFLLSPAEDGCFGCCWSFSLDALDFLLCLGSDNFLNCF
jgi:hypothetical protein